MEEIINLKEGIKLHLLNNKKYKSNVVAAFLTTKLSRETVTKNALIPAVLRLGTNKLNTQQEINKKLEEMYGASFNCGIEKRGDNHVLKFYIESINDSFTLEKEDILKQSIDILFDIIMNPYAEKNTFKKSYVDGEKENLRRIIEGKIDNKTTYAYVRCLEEMYKNKLFGLYQYGYVEDLKDINEANLFEYYKDLLNNCKIDVFVSGDIENKDKLIKGIGSILEPLTERNPEFFDNSYNERVEEFKELDEKMDINQGKLVISLTLAENDYAVCSVYNAILGGGANSKLFQNVREKASLAYTAGSGYLKSKNIIAIRCGIEIPNKDKAVKIIKEQLEDIKQGKFSQKDIDDAKELIVAGLRSMQDEQINEISYKLSEELTNKKEEIEECIKEIKDVKKEDIINVANGVKISTIYFLRN